MSNSNSSGSCGVGFICNIGGLKSHAIVALGVEAVKNLTHRGAVGADGKTGDGAGVMTQIPKKFLLREVVRLGASLSDSDNLAVGFFFLYGNRESDVEAIFRRYGLKFFGWRDVPTNNDALGKAALSSRPGIRQALLDTSGVVREKKEITLYLIRREIEKAFPKEIYVSSLSSRIIVYKGMLVATRLNEFYPDLTDKDYESAFCVFHQRFSTNTSPDWTLAQPFRALAHNGEINTIQGNRNAMTSLEHEVRHEVFGDDSEAQRPLVSRVESDSASLDRIVELLILSGYTPEHAINMCIPPAWEESGLGANVKAFFEYQSLLMKPWDGPAAVTFTDGETIGAHMDRNGLRPLRYTLTEDGVLLLGSETGMVDLGQRAIKEKGRLGPGETISVNLRNGAIRFTDEILNELASQKPYTEWLGKFHRKVKTGTAVTPKKDNETVRKQIAFGYTSEEIHMQIKEMAETGKEPIFSMGDDTPLPSLSERPQLLFRYFKQRFSQVTNPPIDPIRERMVMSLRMNLGHKRNFLKETPEHAERLGIDSPVLLSGHLMEIENLQAFKIERIPIIYAKADSNLAVAVKNLQKRVIRAVKADAKIIILSDRDVSKDRVAISSLLSMSAGLAALRHERLANRVSFIIETGEARDAHHIACLIAYGAGAVHPWLAFQTIQDLCDRGIITLSHDKALENYKKTLDDGLLKVIARMGISTINSYHGAQLFDSICLNKDFIDEYFGNTPVNVQAHGMPDIESSLLARHAAGFDNPSPSLDYGGELKYRKDGERHGWSPPTVAALNRFMKSGDYNSYKEFSRKSYERPVFIRHLLDYKKGISLPLDKIEPEESILKRFFSGAMSVGALSPEAHETIAESCNRLGIKSNSGEGGEDPERYFTIKGSAIKQIASGRFGVTPAYLASAADMEIKIAQGAKPGEGGHLPEIKVTEYIAGLRHCKPNMLLISPPPHHDIYSIEDLAQLIHDLKQANPEAHVCVKLVAETGVGAVAAGVAKAYADIVQISGCEGGTGAASITSIKNAGSYWEIGLIETQRVLMENGLREKIRVRVDGGLRTGRDVVVAAALGAEEFGFGTATMIAAGCVMARRCHSNACPTGIATQDENLRKRFRGTVEGITSYFRALAREVREIMAEMGVASLDEVIGRPELLIHPREPGRMNLSLMFDEYPEGARRCALYRNDNPAPSMNDGLLHELLPYIERAEPVRREYEIRNIDRSIPVKLNYYIARKYRDEGLPPDTIQLTFKGAAGQSFGAFNHKGLSLTLIGDANDYAAKGMYGGRIAIIRSGACLPATHGHVIVGNTVLYGAIGGEFYAAGAAGERFAVRNSGALAVIEGAGHHLCEYMTKGTVVVLGETGYNVGAGMTGGEMYVISDKNNNLKDKINSSYVKISELNQYDIRVLKSMIELHHRYTHSPRAEDVLSDFDRTPRPFSKVVPL